MCAWRERCKRRVLRRTAIAKFLSFSSCYSPDEAYLQGSFASRYEHERTFVDLDIDRSIHVGRSLDGVQYAFLSVEEREEQGSFLVFYTRIASWLFGPSWRTESKDSMISISLHWVSVSLSPSLSLSVCLSLVV